MVELALRAEPDAAHRARRFVAEALLGAPLEVVEDAQLVVTELVTNAQLHGEPPVVVRARPVEGGARLEVADSSRSMLVLPPQSADAMTGRGLSLVAALAAAWGVQPAGPGGKVVWAEVRPTGVDDLGGEVDLDVLLAGWDDGPTPEPEFPVKLGVVPTSLLLEAKRHIDNVVRELTLELAGGGEHLPAGLGALVETVTRDFALARAGIKRLAAEAVARGDQVTELRLTLPLSFAGAGERYLQALDEADGYARDARLLSLETPPLHKLFRRWYVRAVVEQLRARSRGEAPPAPEPFVEVLAAEVSALSGLRGTAQRLGVLQDVNADLARARTAQDMADAVVSRCVSDLGALAARAYVVRGNVLHCISVAGASPVPAADWVDLPLAAELPGPVAHRTGRPVVLRDVSSLEERFPLLKGVLETERSLHVIPLVAGTHRLGVLSLSVAPESALAAEERTAFVQALADVLAQALERVDTTRRRPTSSGALDHALFFRDLPTAYMVMDRDLVLVSANDAYLATVGRTREEILGRHVFDAFPPTPDALDPETGLPRVQLSFERARDTGQVDVMPVQRYDIPDPVGGGFVERFWSLVSIPVLDAEGRVAFIAQRADDISDFMREKERGNRLERDSAAWRSRVQEVEADLYARGAELEAATGERDRTARRLTTLASVALELSEVETVEALERVMFQRGVSVLGVHGGGVGVVDGDVVRMHFSESLDTDVMSAFAVLPLDSALPSAAVARTGERILLPDLAAARAVGEEVEAVLRSADRESAAVLPLRVGEALLGSLAVSWQQPHVFGEEEIDLLEGFAALAAQSLQRLLSTEAQSRAADAALRMSESLQRSLLTEPPAMPGLQLEVRYRPAAALAHVGGDWYDAFVPAVGDALLAIGDVTGHDRVAAAAMGQLRNLLRGLAYDSTDGPAQLLTRLDRAVDGLELGVLATALLARVERADSGVLLRWSSAGHLPLLVRSPDGDVTLLDHPAELMLGVDASVQRRQHVTPLPPGSTAVLFTDGLVERRDRDLGAGLTALAEAFRALGGGTAAEVADGLLATVDEGANPDDIALLVLHVQE